MLIIIQSDPQILRRPKQGTFSKFTNSILMNSEEGGTRRWVIVPQVEGKDVGELNSCSHKDLTLPGNTRSATTTASIPALIFFNDHFP